MSYIIDFAILVFPPFDFLPLIIPIFCYSQMWKSVVGHDVSVSVETQGDDWDTDPDFVVSLEIALLGQWKAGWRHLGHSVTFEVTSKMTVWDWDSPHGETDGTCMISGVEDGRRQVRSSLTLWLIGYDRLCWRSKLGCVSFGLWAGIWAGRVIWGNSGVTGDLKGKV